MLDVGGGSTELSVDGRDPVSLDVGTVRLTERFLRRSATADELAAAAGTCASSCRRSRRDAAIGVAGTVTTLAALELGGYDRTRVHGYRLAVETVDGWLERLASLPLEERRRLPGPRARAGAGHRRRASSIVREVLRAYGLAELEASEHDLLDGAALAAAELPEPEEGAAPPGAYTCC